MDKSENMPWSCDTFVVLPDYSQNGFAMFGKTYAKRSL